MVDFKIEPFESGENPDWDRFLKGTPGGHHVQTSLWAIVKSSVGQKTMRVLATDGGSIIGGGQITVARVPGLGDIGFVPRGPIAAADRHEIMPALIDEVRSAAWSAGLKHLTVQPPLGDTYQTELLAQEGFSPTDQELVPAASTIVDLTSTEEELLLGMHKKTRYNIRLAARKGVTVRDGTEADLETFARFANLTGTRQGFEPYPASYYETMYHVFAEHGYSRLLMAEYESTPLVASLSIGFGSTMISKLPVWSGEHGDLHPNELAHWESMRAAKELGKTAYDFEGIDVRAASAMLAGEPLPETLRRSVARFKLNFGGDVVLFPPAHFDAPNRVVKWGYRSIVPRLSKAKPIRKIRARLRTRPDRSPAKSGSSP